MNAFCNELHDSLYQCISHVFGGSLNTERGFSTFAIRYTGLDLSYLSSIYEELYEDWIRASKKENRSNFQIWQSRVGFLRYFVFFQYFCDFPNIFSNFQMIFENLGWLSIFDRFIVRSTLPSLHYTVVGVILQLLSPWDRISACVRTTISAVRKQESTLDINHVPMLY